MLIPPAQPAWIYTVMYNLTLHSLLPVSSCFCTFASPSAISFHIQLALTLSQVAPFSPSTIPSFTAGALEFLTYVKDLAMERTGSPRPGLFPFTAEGVPPVAAESRFHCSFVGVAYAPRMLENPGIELKEPLKIRPLVEGIEGKGLGCRMEVD